MTLLGMTLREKTKEHRRNPGWGHEKFEKTTKYGYVLLLGYTFEGCLKRDMKRKTDVLRVLLLNRGSLAYTKQLET